MTVHRVDQTDLTDRHADRQLLDDAVRAAGALARDYFEKGAKSWDKAHNDPVSEADLALDRLLHDRLIGARPGYGWMSEESVDNAARLGAERLWVVDPIDGTRAFIKHLPEFSVSVALVERGRPVLGAVYNPITEEYFAASAGGGATLNGATIRASGATSLLKARLLASRSRHFKHTPWEQATAGASYSYRNSIAYRMALVAAGRYEAAISLSPKSDWDIAAAYLIVAEAGGITSTREGQGFHFNQATPRHPSVIATASGVHDEVVALLAQPLS